MIGWWAGIVLAFEAERLEGCVKKAELAMSFCSIRIVERKKQGQTALGRK